MFVIIPRRYKIVYVNYFLPDTARFWNSLPSCRFFDLWSKLIFMLFSINLHGYLAF